MREQEVDDGICERQEIWMFYIYSKSQGPRDLSRAEAEFNFQLQLGS